MAKKRFLVILIPLVMILFGVVYTVLAVDNPNQKDTLITAKADEQTASPIDRTIYVGETYEVTLQNPNRGDYDNKTVSYNINVTTVNGDNVIELSNDTVDVTGKSGTNKFTITGKRAGEVTICATAQFKTSGNSTWPVNSGVINLTVKYKTHTVTVPQPEGLKIVGISEHHDENGNVAGNHTVIDGRDFSVTYELDGDGYEYSSDETDISSSNPRQCIKTIKNVTRDTEIDPPSVQASVYQVYVPETEGLEIEKITYGTVTLNSETTPKAEENTTYRVPKGQKFTVYYQLKQEGDYTYELVNPSDSLERTMESSGTVDPPKVKARTYKVTVPKLTEGLQIGSILIGNASQDVENVAVDNDWSSGSINSGEEFIITYVPAYGYKFVGDNEDGVRKATTTTTIDSPAVQIDQSMIVVNNTLKLKKSNEINTNKGSLIEPTIKNGESLKITLTRDEDKNDIQYSVTSTGAGIVKFDTPITIFNGSKTADFIITATTVGNTTINISGGSGDKARYAQINLTVTDPDTYRVTVPGLLDGLRIVSIKNGDNEPRTDLGPGSYDVNNDKNFSVTYGVKDGYQFASSQPDGYSIVEAEGNKTCTVTVNSPQTITPPNVEVQGYKVTVPALTPGLKIASIKTYQIVEGKRQDKQTLGTNVVLQSDTAYPVSAGDTFEVTYEADTNNDYSFTDGSTQVVRTASKSETIVPPTVQAAYYYVTVPKPAEGSGLSISEVENNEGNPAYTEQEYKYKVATGKTFRIYFAHDNNSEYSDPDEEGVRTATETTTIVLPEVVPKLTATSVTIKENKTESEIPNFNITEGEKLTIQLIKDQNDKKLSCSFSIDNEDVVSLKDVTDNSVVLPSGSAQAEITLVAGTRCETSDITVNVDQYNNKEKFEKSFTCKIKVTVVPKIYQVTVPTLSEGLIIDSIKNGDTTVANPMPGIYYVNNHSSFVVTYKTKTGYVYDKTETSSEYRSGDEIKKIEVENPETSLAIEQPQVLCLVKKPTVINNLTYNGKEQSGVDYEHNSQAYEIQENSVISEKDAKSYSATFKLNPGYIWANMTKDDVKIDWSINKKSLVVQANDKEIACGDTLPDLDYVVTGILETDDINVDNQFECSCSYDSNSVTQREYEIGVQSKDSFTFDQNNYQIVYKPGKLTVNGLVAKYNNLYYSLAGAINAATNGMDKTVELIEDITLAEAVVLHEVQLKVNNKRTIDLAGCQLTYSGSDSAIWVGSDGDLTIKDSSSGGTINSGSNPAIKVNAGSTTGNDALAKNATLRVKSGTIEGSVTGNNHSIISIEGGTVSSIDVQNGLFLSVANGVVSNINVSNPGYFLVSDGTIGSIEMSGCNNENAAIKGGTFTGSVTSQDSQGFITGGSFTNELNSSLIAEGFGQTASDDKYIVDQSSSGSESPHCKEHTYGRWEPDENGVTHSRTCSTCKETETTIHNWTNPTFTWLYQTSGDIKANFQITCADCGYITPIQEAVITSEDDNENRVYTASVTIDGKTYTETKTVKISYTVYISEEIADADFVIEGSGVQKINDYSYRVPYGTTITVKSKNTEQHNKYDFTVKDDVGETPGVNNSETFKYNVSANITVGIKSHVDKNAPVITIRTENRTKTSDNKYKVTFQINWMISPESKCTFVEAGYYYRYGGINGAEIPQDIILSKGSVKKTSLNCKNGTFKFIHTYSSSYATRNIYAIGYLIYKNDNGEATTIYTTNPAINEYIK